MAPKRPPSTATSTPTITASESLSFANVAKPFKNPQYDHKARRKAKTLKQILTWERERERINRQNHEGSQAQPDIPTYLSLSTPPSLIPAKKYCDLTGLLAPYTDPKSGLRYASAEVYSLVSSMPVGAHQAYLAIRGAASVIK